MDRGCVVLDQPQRVAKEGISNCSCLSLCYVLRLVLREHSRGP